MSNAPPKLDKKLLSKIASFARQNFNNDGYHDGTYYLEADEIQARAWVKAYTTVLNAMGYQITRKDKDNGEK